MNESSSKNTNLEVKIFKRFIAKNRQERFGWNLSSAKRREKIFDDLRDTRHFDESKFSEVENPEDVVEYLRNNRVSKRIYIISSEEDLDGKTVSIERLRESAFWMPEEIIGYCTKANVGFFKNHEECYFLLR